MEGHFLGFFSFFFFFFFAFCFSGQVAFGFLAFVVFVAFHFASSAFTLPLCLSLWVHAAFAALAFRILCIASFAAAGGFLALWLLAAFWLWLFASSLAQLVFGLGFLHPQHRQFLPGPPTPLSIKMHDHHATATF